MKRRFTDADVVALLLSNDTRQHDQAIQDLHHAHSATLIRWVQQHNGSYEDGEEIAGDALMAFFKNVRSGTFGLRDTKILTYLHEVAKRRWFRRLRDENPRYFGTLNLDERQLADVSAEEPVADGRQEQFWELVGQLNERCRRLIKAVVDGYSMQEIAQMLGLTNAANAKAHKYQCMQKLNELRKN